MDDESTELELLPRSARTRWTRNQRNSFPGLQELAGRGINGTPSQVCKNSLDDESTELLAYNAFTSIAKEEKWGGDKVGQGENADKRNAAPALKADAQTIEMDSFVKAVLRAEPLDFGAFATAYDRLDGANCFEAVFAEDIHTTLPGETRKAVKKESGGILSDLTQ